MSALPHASIGPPPPGLIGAALRAGIIPPDWRRFTWDEGLHWPSAEIIAQMTAWTAAQGQAIEK